MLMVQMLFDCRHIFLHYVFLILAALELWKISLKLAAFNFDPRM